MTDMTAEARAEIVLKNLIYLDKADQLTKITDQIHQAEAAARRKALEEAAQIVSEQGNLLTPRTPGWLAFNNGAGLIRALMDNPND